MENDQEISPIEYLTKTIWLCTDWDTYTILLFHINWMRKKHAFTGKFRVRHSICFED